MTKLFQNLKHKKVFLPLLLAVLFVSLPQITFAVDGLELGIITVLNTFVIGVFGTLVGLSGGLLDFAITSFVVGFGDLYQNSGLGFSIDNLWSTVRDIFNLTFIFGLVFIGFKMIFNSSDSNARKMLGSLVLAALLVNFSLFITKFVIDFANIAASQLAGGFLINGKYEVSSRFVDIMGLGTIFNAGGNALTGLPGGAGFSYIIGSLLLYLVATFVFAAGAILLTIRFAVLNIYMVLSPVMFLGWVFPGFSSVSREYWSGFMSRAFYAPAYILMLYFSHQILANMKDVVAAGSGGNMASSFLQGSQASAVSSLPFFIMASVFLVASLVIGQKMGSVGASNAIAIGRRVSGKVRSAATYIPRRVAREGANRLGEGATKRLNSIQSGNGRFAKIMKSNGADRVLRGAAGAAASARYGTSGSNKEQRDYKAKTEARAKNTKDLNEAVEFARLDKQFKEDPSKMSAQDAARHSVLKPREDELQGYVAGMSTSAIEEMGEKDRQEIADMFTSTQAENINKSDKISDKEKADVTKARQAAINKLIGTSGAFITEELNKLSINQIETLGETWLANNSHVLSVTQMEEVKKSKKYTEAQKSTFGNNRKTKLASLASSTLPMPTEFEQVMKDKKPKDIAKLPANLLMHPSALKYLSAAVLREIATNGTLDSAQQSTLETTISLFPSGADPSAVGYFSSTHAKNNWG